MPKANQIFAALFVFFCLPQIGYPQMFGKNDVQYTNFDWHFIQSQHFDVYFYPGGEQAADFVADVAESSYVSISNSWDYKLRDRIRIMLYNSHNDFEQTNLNIGPPEESVGGFTEFYKNRIAIPYDGSYEQLRHVTNHELTHAVLLQMLFGTGTFSIISGITRSNTPLWFVEGLAEYQSRHGWDTESDMFIRDATLNGYLPPIPYLYGFMAYKGGQSVLYYIEQRYGAEKVGELLTNMRRFKDVDRAIRATLSMSTYDLTAAWHKHLQKLYWPEVRDRHEPGAFARQLTFHRQERNFINNSGQLSPGGDRIAYLSDKTGYFDIYLASTITGAEISRLVSGQKSGRLEELHWLRPGISWSPDGDKIVFAAKSREQDALHVVDVDSRKIVASHTFDLDAIFAPDWSPDGARIAFVGSAGGASDIYVFHLKSGHLEKITFDVFSDLEPRWSPDGSKIVFISDRTNHVTPDTLSTRFKIQKTDYHQFDIYVVDVTTRRIERITETPANEKSPVWSPDGKRLAYVSDLSGIFNIYIMPVPKRLVLAAADSPDSSQVDPAQEVFSEPAYPITNVLTGIDHLSWEGERLSFTSFYSGGFDIYVMNKPLHTQAGEIKLAETDFVQARQKKSVKQAEKHLNTVTENDTSATAEFDNFVFGKEFKKGKTVNVADPRASLFLSPESYKTADDKYVSQKYKTKFTADVITANAGYDPFFGFQGATLVSFSDLLSNHRINFLTDVFVDLKNSDFALSYEYLPRQTDYNLGVYLRNYLFLSQGRFLVRDRNLGMKLHMSRPFDRYTRLTYGMHFKYIFRKNLFDFESDPEIGEVLPPDDTRKIFLADISYTKDNVLWNMIGPMAGTRFNVSIQASPDLGSKGLDFRIYQLDYRTYWNFAKNYTWAVRFAAGFSEGRHRQKFFIGGTGNWINHHFRNDVALELDDVYFSNFVLPLRGHDYYAQVGSKFFATNMELRIPFVNYVQTTWPLPLRLSNIRGALFTDFGSAWDDDFHVFVKSADSGLRLDDVLMSFGWGARVNLGIFLLRYDMAWRTDLDGVSGARQLFSLGADF